MAPLLTVVAPAPAEATGDRSHASTIPDGRMRMIVCPLVRFGRIEGGDGIVEGCDVTDIRPQSSVAHPLDDLTQLVAISRDDGLPGRSSCVAPCSLGPLRQSPTGPDEVAGVAVGVALEVVLVL